MVAASAFAQRDGGPFDPPPQREMPEFVPGSMWVKLDQTRPQAHDATLQIVRALAGTEATKTYWLVPGLHLVRVPVGSERALVALARELEGVEWTSVEGVGTTTQNSPATCLQPEGVPEDEHYGDQYWVQSVNLDDAWDALTNIELPLVTVAVIDSGVNYNHPDLIDNMWVNPGEIAGNAIDDDANEIVDDVHGAAFVQPPLGDPCASACSYYEFCPTCPQIGDPPQICSWCDDADDAGNPGEPPSGNGGDLACLVPVPFSADGSHGTACASIIAASPNTIAVRGFACNLRVMGIRLWNWCSDNGFRESSYIEGLQYVVANGVTVVSSSLQLLPPGGGGAAMTAAISELGDHDVVFVTSAGNESCDLDDPVCEPVYAPQRINAGHVINVGATDSSDQLAPFSNFGEVITDVMAPGVGIRTFDLNSVSGQGYLDGTSFAAPMVAAAAALYRSVYPAATAADVRAAIVNTARPVASLSDKCEAGGILDVHALLQ